MTFQMLYGVLAFSTAVGLGIALATATDTSKMDETPAKSPGDETDATHGKPSDNEID